MWCQVDGSTFSRSWYSPGEWEPRRMYHHKESNKTSLQHCPSTKVTREPIRQSPGRTRDLLVYPSLILTRPTKDGRKTCEGRIKQTFQMSIQSPSMQFNFKFPRCSDVPYQSTIPGQDANSKKQPKEEGESRWTTLYKHLLAVSIFVHWVHLYTLFDLFSFHIFFR